MKTKHSPLAIKVLLILTCFFSVSHLLAQSNSIISPNGHLRANVSISDQLSFSLYFKDILVLGETQIAMELSDGLVLGQPSAFRGFRNSSHTESRVLVVSSKDKMLSYEYNQMTLEFEHYSIEFRLFDDGLAYRFATNLKRKKQMEVVYETMDLKFPAGTWSYYPEEKSLYSHYEQHYDLQPLDSIPAGSFCALPVRFTTPEGVGILVTEADQFDYPGLFLEKNDSWSFKSKFPPVILSSEPLASRPDRYEVITSEAPYIAATSPKRSFPWRVIMVSDDDRDFVESNLVMQLSRPSMIAETNWIQPGKVAWDWYNANNIYGVDFESGINTETYKYYIDFASQYELEYVILDEGWTKSTVNVMESNPDIDLPELVAYANEKDVGIILWLLWHPLDKNLDEILKLYSSWGIKGVKVDFMQRADQYMVKSYEEIAKTAAKYKLMVDFHGSFKPAGLSSAYPNVMTYEGVMGNENNKWGKLITPEHNVTLPFTRMVAGPMDYTPGAMANAQARNFNISFDRPMSQGTRCHQAAMYVVYESPLQMLCDAPSAYLKETDYTKFIAGIPADWDETRVLEGKIADYIVVARRKGSTWYIGAMTDQSPRDFDLDLSFLGNGTFEVRILMDGINASRYGQDYKLDELKISSSISHSIHLAPGGGWVAILTPVDNE